ncbi:MAG: valine--tRNA ligase [Streptococcaceae bacterium]|nr:valine--tRNA ligase [Streptococcaceae bacterium]
MSENLSTKYQPKEVEAGKYQWWLEQNFFKPSGDVAAKPYSIVIPPPNVTGKLHLGHAWDTTLQDMIIRQKRMQGFDTLWLPGMDHAGIATQAKVEARLAEEGISRHDLGREKFLEKVWEWKDEYAATIKEQWGKLGLSVDYSRERFTLDEGLSKAVRKVFVSLYDKGLIYRGEKLINWDPKAQTALSDIEVIHKDVNGAFYHINYQLTDGTGVVEIATTRPETYLGDTAVIVNPADERYQHLIGKTVTLPIINRIIPILADEHADMTKGTGIVKITPAHDPNDFEVALRHHLPMINMMNNDGTINAEGGKYEGLDRFVARKQIINDLKELGALVDIKETVHQVGHSERSGAIVEPRLSTQWFVKMDELSRLAINNQATKDAVTFFPPRFNQTFMRWMEGVHDWVISRQLWWGHQIPAWYHKTTGEVYVGMAAPEDVDNWEQDTDVLDTWFSSALWPFSTMGWPNTEAADFKRYFPTSTLVTGYDIIFFWVSRMIFQSLEFTGERPFENVLIHGLIRDEEGRKMSKSLGNGIDPMDVIEKYGADALRWFLINGSTPGQDIRFSYEKMDAAWNFINKIWNVSRYIIMNTEGISVTELDFSNNRNATDDWILTRLNQTIDSVSELFDKFEFSEAGRILYNFIWDEFADWYIELTKEVLYGEDESAKQTTKSVLIYVLDQILRLLHPIMPFVTEEIWQKIPHDGQTILTADYPVAEHSLDNPEALLGVEAMKELIRAVRNIRSEVNTPLSKKIKLLIQTKDATLDHFLKANENYIVRFTNPEVLEISSNITPPKLAMSAVLTGAEIFLPLADLINLDEEINRLGKDLAKWTKEVERVQKKLANERFVASAPEAVVSAERDKEKDYLEKQAAVRERIAELKAEGKADKGNNSSAS